jgi:hypothetical protein
MKHKYALCCLSILLSVSLQGCTTIYHEAISGSGNTSEETYTLAGLTGVELATIGELEIRLGDKEELQISTDDNLQQYFEAAQDGDVLKIQTRGVVSLRPSQAVRYTLTVKELEFIGLSSSGNAHAPALSADHFEVRIKSSGNVSVDHIKANSLSVHITSSGDVKIGKGVVDVQEIQIHSSGDYDGESVRSSRATVRLSSGGNARLWVEKSLEANLTSSGSVYYQGDPEVDESHSSTGRVQRIRERVSRTQG